jgi:hypothetical protein
LTISLVVAAERVNRTPILAIRAPNREHEERAATPLNPRTRIRSRISSLQECISFRVTLGGVDALRGAFIVWAHRFPLWGCVFPTAFAAVGAVASVAMVHRLAPETSGSGITLPRMRDDFGCTWIERGGSLAPLTRILGHSSVKVTERYARLSDHMIRREADRIYRGFCPKPYQAAAGTALTGGSAAC